MGDDRAKTGTRAPLLVLLVLAYALSRIPIYATRAVVFDPEQAVAGNFAQDLLDGLVLPWTDYQYAPFAHGPLIFGAVLAPFYALFGRSYAVLLLVSLLWTTATVAVWLVAVERAFGRLAALSFGLLAVFAPPFVLEMTTTAWANHTESLLPVGIALLALRAALARPSPARAWMLGLVCGLGTTFCFQTSTVAAVLLLVWRVVDRGAPLRARVVPWAGGFALGFAPSLYWNAVTGEWYRALRAGTLEPTMTRAGKLFALAADILPGLARFPDPRWSRIYFAVVAAAWAVSIVGVPRLVREKTADADRFAAALRGIVLVFPLAWALAYVASGWEMYATIPDGARYAIVVAPFLAVAVASLGRRRRAGIALAIALSVTAWVGGGRAMTREGIALLREPDARERLTQFRGTAYDHTLRTLRGEVLRAKTPDEAVGFLRCVSPRYLDFVDATLGALCARRGDPAAPVVAARDADRVLAAIGREAMVRHLDGKRSPWMGATALPEAFWTGVGEGTVAALARDSATARRMVKGALREGVAASEELGGITPALLAFADIVRPLDDGRRRAAVAGLGAAAAEISPAIALAHLAVLVRREPWIEGARGAWLVGVGRGVAREAVVDRARVRADFVVRALQAAGWDPRSFAANPLPAVEHGFRDELERLGYRLDPIPGGPWLDVVYAGPDRVPEATWEAIREALRGGG